MRKHVDTRSLYPHIMSANEVKRYFAEKENTMKTNFTVTDITIMNSIGSVIPNIDMHIKVNGLDFVTSPNRLIAIENLKDIVESKLNAPYAGIPPIKKVIFSNPATIVFWEDGTKTVVKCSKDDTFSEYAGLSMCITKKLLGSNFKKEMNKWCNKPDTVEKKSSDSIDFSKALDAADNAFRMLRASLYNDRLREEASESLNVLCNTLNDLTKNYKSAK